MIPFLAMVVVLAGVQTAGTPAAADLSEPRRVSEEAMKLVAANDMKALVDLLRRNMPLKKGDLDSVQAMLDKQRKPLSENLGKALGYGFISECRRSDYLVQLTYVEKREKNVIRWLFYFYKPRNAWHMSYFFMDENYAALFQPCP